MQSALLACVHLSGLSDSCYHDACVFDLCMGGSETPSEEWYEEHNPPEDITCKVVADPHFTPFSDYKFAFNGEGAYSVIEKKASGETDPCSVDIQTFECPGNGVQSYMAAVGITATGGDSTHEIVLKGDSCTIDGEACGTEEGKNVGTDGVMLVPYTPGAKGQPSMGDFGPGVKGWYVYAAGFKANVTKTVGPDGEDMMNLIVATPPMCTSGASGLCTTSASTADKKLQVMTHPAVPTLPWRPPTSRRVICRAAPRVPPAAPRPAPLPPHTHTPVPQAFAAEYLMHKAKKETPSSKQQELLSPNNIPELDKYDALGAGSTMAGLKGLSCPASKK